MLRFCKITLIGVLPILAMLAGLGGCGNQDAQEARLRDMQSQLIELKRTIADQNVRIEELNNRLYLVEDRLPESKEQAQREDLKVVKLVPKAEDSEKPQPKQLTSMSDTSKNQSSSKNEPILISNWKRGPDKHVSPKSKASSGGVKNLYEQGLKQYRKKNYGEATVLLGKLVREHPDTSYTDNAIFWIGVCYLEQHEHDLAIAEFEKVLTIKKSNKIPDAMYYLGLSYRRKGNADQADKIWTRLKTRYPKSEAAAKLQSN